MKKILFIYDHNRPERLEFDGLWCALNLLEKDFEIKRIRVGEPYDLRDHDFVLGWGGFDSEVDKFINRLAKGKKYGLCLAAQMPTNSTAKDYDVIFYETESIRKWLELEGLKNLVHAFGINTDIFKVSPISGFKVYDAISVGSFSKWHRQDLLYDFTPGIVVGDVQQDNIQESFNYVANLILKGWTVSNWVDQKKLAQLYNLSRKCILTADFGQERAVLEARACGIPVEVSDDNPKLNELLTTPIYNVNYYYEQLKKGIESCL